MSLHSVMPDIKIALISINFVVEAIILLLL